jgi:hypothetical protein
MPSCHALTSHPPAFFLSQERADRSERECSRLKAQADLLQEEVQGLENQVCEKRRECGRKCEMRGNGMGRSYLAAPTYSLEL